MTINELTSYYSGLLAYQYRGLPNADRQMQLYARQFLADGFARQLLPCFDLDLAVGKQLDTLGKYIGVSRNIGIILPRPYFGLWTYASTRDLTKYQGTWTPATDNPTLPTASGGNSGNWYVADTTGESALPIVESFQAGDIIFSNGTVWAKETADNGKGLTTYSDLSVNSQGVFFSYDYSSSQNSDLTDAEYRTVLKLKVILNSNDGTLKTIMDFLQLFFPGLITVTDTADMHLSYLVVSSVPLSLELLTLFLPKPMGVGITITIISPPPAGGSDITTEGGDTLTTEGGDTLTTEGL